MSDVCVVVGMYKYVWFVCVCGVEYSTERIHCQCVHVLSPQNGVAALDVAREHGQKELCQIISKATPPATETMVPPTQTTPPPKPSQSQTTPTGPEERRRAPQVCGVLCLCTINVLQYIIIMTQLLVIRTLPTIN